MHALHFSRVAVLLLIAACLAPLGADEPKSKGIVLETRGYLVPATQITVSPKVAGQVVQLMYDEGHQVKAGDILAKLDAEEYKAALALARAKLLLAEAKMAKAREGGSQADRAIAEAQIVVARAAIDLADYKLGCTVILAPTSGIILAKRAEVGTRIDPRATQLPASLCDMADLTTLDALVSIPERDLPKIGKGQACVVLVDALPNAKLRGRVVRLQPVADRARGAVTVRVRLDKTAAGAPLRPELSAVVQFLAQQ